MTAAAGDAVLTVEDLRVEIAVDRARIEPVRGVSFELRAGEIKGLVGETGSGKSMTSRAIMRLLPHGGRIVGGRVCLKGVDLASYDEKRLRAIRGAEIGLVFQNPRTALHPLLTVERQMSNVIRAHSRISKSEQQERIRESLRLAGLPDHDRVARAYPHELSGGMAQRVVIATVLLSNPAVVIADEPTTGLDLTVQRQILDLLAELRERLGLAVLLITHDLGIVAQYCSSVLVMHDGLIVESGEMRHVLQRPQAEYTRRLISASQLTGLRHEVAR
jgi:ABC-type dipeptide/oligopeptide/nickel transport system ATPase component